MSEYIDYKRTLIQNNIIIGACKKRSSTKEEFINCVKERLTITNEETFTNIYWEEKNV